MRLKTELKDIRWWFWAITLVFIVTALAGRSPSFYLVMAISAILCKSGVLPPSLLRTGWSIFYSPSPREVRLYIYALLLLGTTMVTFFARCAIALMLQLMPWNRGREVRLN